MHTRLVTFYLTTIQRIFSLATEEVDEELKKTDLWQGWHEQIEKRLAEIEEEIEDE